MTERRVLVLGVDGGTWATLRPYMEEGTMPNLGRIVEEGAHGVLRSVIPPITAPAWASFATGVNPGRHGCYYFLHVDSTGRFRPITSADIMTETFYETLVRNGYRCTLINLPVSYPARIERTVITSLLSSGDDIFFPPEIVDEIPALSDYEIVPSGLGSPESKRDFTVYKELVIQNEGVRFEVAKELFQRSWDFFFLLFSGCDWISHQVFSEMVSGEGPEAEGAREYFEKLDEWIGWFCQNSDSNTLKLIVSDHGFRVRKGTFSTNAWLKQKGFLNYKRGYDTSGMDQDKRAMKLFSPGKASLKPSVARIRDGIQGNRLTSWVVPRLKRIFERPGMLRRMVASDLSVDLDNSRAVGTVEGIYVLGREKDDDTTEEIIESLNDLNQELGIFSEALRREDVYWGPHVEKAPDVVILGADYQPSREKTEEAYAEHPVPGHDKDGIWVISGPRGVAGSRMNASLMDIAPTVLDWMGVEPSFEPDGKSLLRKLGAIQ